MSLAPALQTLRNDTFVTFNKADDAGGRVPPALRVSEFWGRAVAEFVDDESGRRWRVVERDGELVIQRGGDPDRGAEWSNWEDFDGIDTLHLIPDPNGNGSQERGSA